MHNTDRIAALEFEVKSLTRILGAERDARREQLEKVHEHAREVRYSVGELKDAISEHFGDAPNGIPYEVERWLEPVCHHSDALGDAPLT